MMQLQGADELIRKLARLSGKDGKAAVRKGCRAGAKIVQAEVKRRVPRLSGKMARSLKVRSLKRKKGREGVRVAVDARNAKGEPYGFFVEYGTKVHVGGRIRRKLAGRGGRPLTEAELKRNAAYQSLDWRIRPRHFMGEAATTRAHVALRVAQEAMRDEIERIAAA